VLRQVLPEISRSAQNTITGKIKVTVQVAVDASGNVSQATLTSAGPSKYFAARTLEAARQWKFDPPRAAGNATDSKWNLRFQLGRASTQVSPTEIKP
jgi:TonB family protein